MNSTIYYEDQLGVMVTDRCVTIGDNTYSTESIVSVTTAPVNPRRLGVALAAVIAAGCMFFGVASASYKWSIFGAVLAIICAAAYRKTKTMWRLRIATTLGETSPFQSANHQKVSTVAHAIGQAIAHRA